MPEPHIVHEAILRRTFPFLLKVERRGRLVQVGSMWGRVCADVQVGALLESCFVLDPEDTRLIHLGRWDHLRGRALTLRHRRRTLRLQGELHEVSDQGLLLISPVFTSARQVASLGIELSDLPASQPITATLTALTSLTRSLREQQDLADVLRQERLELDRSRLEAEAAASAKARFLAVMSHEIRTPLNGLLGMLDALMDHPMTPTQREQMLVACGVGRDLLSLLNNVLDLSRLEAGELDFEDASLEVRQVVDAALAVLQPRPGVALSVRIMPDVPEWISGDAHRIRQVLVNLGGNACKFTAAGHVRVVVRSVDEQLEIQVCDTGDGVPEELQDRLFEPFTQADVSTTRKHGGSGLGLAITRELVQGMGGTIGLQSELGAGTVVSFRIPLVPAHAPELVAAPPPPRRFKGHVLVAEDNPVNQMVMRLSLQSMGVTTDMVADGLAALEALQTNEYDVVLMDAHMPRMDGLEATRRLRERWPDLPVVACTASTLPDEVLSYREAGMHTVLPKPFQREELAAILERWLPAS